MLLNARMKTPLGARPTFSDFASPIITSTSEPGTSPRLVKYPGSSLRRLHDSNLNVRCSEHRFSRITVELRAWSFFRLCKKESRSLLYLNHTHSHISMSRQERDDTRTDPTQRHGLTISVDILSRVYNISPTPEKSLSATIRVLLPDTSWPGDLGRSS